MPIFIENDILCKKRFKNAIIKPFILLLKRSFIVDKKKLSIPEQIQDMRKKGITFEITDEKSADNFLKYNNYYFKLKAYGKNYDKYLATAKKGQYINLDFAYLQELSTLDMYLRKTIISMSLDIEHALKIQLLYDLTQNDAEDGYHIVKQYLDADYMRIKALHDKIGKSAASDLIEKKQNHDDTYALWEIVEVMSFGEFIDLYQLYYSTYPSKTTDYSSYLWSIKFLRNAAAHNNCLLNNLKAPYHITIHKTREIQLEVSKIKTISSNSRKKWMANPVIHDFIILVFVYLNLIKSAGIKNSGIKQLQWLFDERMPIHKEYFQKNLSIIESYNFNSKIVKYFCNKYRK